MDQTILQEEQQGQPSESLVSESAFSACAQCGHPVKTIKGDSHNFCQNCGFRDSCC